MTITSLTATAPTCDSIDIVDGTLYVRDFVETDAEVVRVVSDADDPVEGTRQCLRIGARAISAVSVNVDTHIVEKRFDAMTDRFDERVEAMVEQISGTARALLDEEDGSLTSTLTNHRGELEELLGATFDPDSKKSVLGIFERVLQESHDKQAEAVRRLVATDGEDSPLARLKYEMSHDLRTQLAGVREEVHVLSEKIAVKDAIAPVIALTTGKGFTYEDVVHDAVGRIAARHGDLAEQTGKVSGSAATLKGDEVVTLDAEDTFGFEGRFVIEAKAKKLNMRKTIEELDAALENREALAAIAVFSAQDEAPTTVAFQHTGNKAIVVFDAEDGDDSALRLGYMWGRWVVRRELAASGADDVDLERIAGLIEDARRAIDRVTAIRRFHTSARKNIDQAAEQVGSLADEVRDALDAVADELAAGDAS